MLIEFRFFDVKGEHSNDILIMANAIVSVNNQFEHKRNQWVITIDLMNHVSYEIVTDSDDIGTTLIKAIEKKQDIIYFDIEDQELDISSIKIIRWISSEEPEEKNLYPTGLKRL